MTFGAVKQTLCGLVLAAGAVTEIGCTTKSASAPTEYAEEHVENVVQHAVNYFNKRQYSTLIDLMQKRNNYLTLRTKELRNNSETQACSRFHQNRNPAHQNAHSSRWLMP